MRTWTNILPLAVLAVLFTLPLAGCAEDGPAGMIEADTITPGDPAIYAPDGWPLQIGDRISGTELERLYDEFQLSGVETRVRPPLGHPGRDGRPWSSPWTRSGPVNLVGNRVYDALIDFDPKVGEYDYVYRGHFPKRFEEFMRHYEPDLPSEYHGKVEYYTPSPYPPLHPDTPLGALDVDNPSHDADGKRLRVDWVPPAPNRQMWVDYPERRK